MALKDNEFIVSVIGIDDFKKGGNPFKIGIDITGRDPKSIDWDSLAALDGVIAHGCLNSSWVKEWFPTANGEKK